MTTPQRAAHSPVGRTRRLAARLPEHVKRRPRTFLWRLQRAWTYDVRWPAPLWRIRGHGWLTIGGHRFRFEQVGRWPHMWWATRAYAGTWEREVIEFLSCAIRPGDTVIDIGAHLGAHTLLASRLVGDAGQVYAFEPDPVARQLLQHNVVANRAGNVTVLPWAVGEQPGPVWLSSGSLGNANTVTSQTGGVLQVTQVKLSAFCEQLGLTPSLIKIDVEGAEAEIVTHDEIDLLRSARALVIEIHEHALERRGIELEDFLARCRTTGKSVTVLGQRAEGNFNIALG